MVKRASDDELARTGMQPQECHANTQFMVNSCPVGRMNQVLGWWYKEDEDVYVLHSVVGQDDIMCCVTPSPHVIENPFQFIPDEKIKMRMKGDEFIFYRNGQIIGPGVRNNPEATLQEMASLRQELESGCDSYDMLPE